MIEQKLIYKYNSWNRPSEPFRDKIITENEIYFSSAASFNDPFDSNQPIRYVDGYEFSTNFYVDYCQQLYEKTGKQVDQKRVMAHASFLKNHVKIDDDLAREIKDAFYETVVNEVGISCFTKDPTNILMWSHYGDCHKGVCLGFELNGLQEEFGYNLQEIRYQKSLYTFSKFGDPQEVFAYLLTKYEDWSYEKEFRLMILNYANKAYRYNRKLLKEIIIGMKMPNQAQDKLVSFLKANYPHTSIKRASSNESSFKIDLLPL